MAEPPTDFARVRRAAEAFHVLWWIDHDGKWFVLTCGEPNEDGTGIGFGRASHATLDESQAFAAEWHMNFMPYGVTSEAPAMKFHYTDAARAAAGIRA